MSIYPLVTCNYWQICFLMMKWFKLLRKIHKTASQVDAKLSTQPVVLQLDRQATMAVILDTVDVGKTELGLPSSLGEVLCSSVQHASVNVTGQL